MRFYFFNRRLLIWWGGLVALILLVSLFFLTGLNGDATGVFARQSRDVPIYGVDMSDKRIAISFDATWGADRTDKLLQILKEYHVKTTFFLTGIWSRQYPEYVKKIAAAGHEIGNHSYNHPHCGQLSEGAFTKELLDTQQLIQQLCGKKTHLFRPPYGEYNNQVIQAAQRQGYEVIQWSVDSLDWQEVGTEAVINRVLKNIKPGVIVLMHNNAKYTPEALPVILKTLQDQGYKIVPVSELLLKGDYYIDQNTGIQKKKQY